METLKFIVLAIGKRVFSLVNNMKYTEPDNGEWVQPVRKGYKMMCCDCGLVHTLNFRVRKKRAQFQAFRNQRSTGQARRHRNITVKKEYDK